MSDTDMPHAEMQLRRLLWLRHGCEHSALYGDDGEMQCGDCILDFKRAPPSEIEDRWRWMSVQRLAADGVEWAQKALEARRIQDAPRSGT